MKKDLKLYCVSQGAILNQVTNPLCLTQNLYSNKKNWESGRAYRHILKEQVTPIVLDIKQQTKDQHQVAQADEDDHHHAA